MHVVLVNPEIPPNTGNIARLCAATNSPLHLIRPLGFFVDDKSLKRAGLDYWEHVKLSIHDSLEDLLEGDAKGQFWLITKTGTKTYTSIKYGDSDYLIFGSETKGLPVKVLQQYRDQTLNIPMFGETRCINLATSVGIVLYEALRQVKGF
jgi:tRNA (cytidine/uridine-2'-O-)-methyltransferase